MFLLFLKCFSGNQCHIILLYFWLKELSFSGPNWQLLLWIRMLSRYNTHFYQSWQCNQAESKQKWERNQQLFILSSLLPSPIFNNLLLSVASIINQLKPEPKFVLTKVWSQRPKFVQVAKWFEAKAEKPYACKAVDQEGQKMSWTTLLSASKSNFLCIETGEKLQGLRPSQSDPWKPKAAKGEG